MIKEPRYMMAIDYMLNPVNRVRLSADEEYAKSTRINQLRDEIYQTIHSYDPKFIDENFPEFRELEEAARRENNPEDQKNPENRWRFVNEMAILYLKKLTPDSSDLDEFAHKSKKPKLNKKRLAQYQHISALYQEWKIASEEFLAANMGLVVKIAKKKMGRGVDLEDLVQEGLSAASRALASFDPKRGFKYSTYAAPWINQATDRTTTYHGTSIARPVHAQHTLSTIKRASIRLLAQKGEASIEDLASETEMSEEQITEYLQMPYTMSLDQSIGFGDGKRTFLDDVPDYQAEDQVSTLYHKQLRKAFQEALSRLSSKEQDILKKRFGFYQGHEEKTLEQIGQEYGGLSRERIRQIEQIALKKLQKNGTLKKFFENL